MDPIQLIPHDPITAIVAAICAIMAGYERFINRKKELRTESENALVSDAKMHQDRAEQFRKIADDNMKMYQDERDSHTSTRSYWHDKATKDQAALSEAQNQLAEYKSRPDFNVVVALMRQQSEALTHQAEASNHALTSIDVSLSKLTTLVEKLAINQTPQ